MKLIKTIIVILFIILNVGSSSEQTSIDDNDYIIITTDSLIDSITSSDFIEWKSSIGYSITITSIHDEDINNIQGSDLSEKIRNYLISEYEKSGLKYVMIVGNIRDIPMRYCYPDPDNHKDYRGNPLLFDLFKGGEVPTDAYYADLSLPDSESWDSDGDGFYGEANEDNPDFFPEISVGRIPTSDPERVKYCLDKIVTFEKDTSDWKFNALNVGAFSYFKDEDGSTRPNVDGADLINEIEKNIMNEDWTFSHYCEKEGLRISSYDWPALLEETFTDDWRENKYGMVNWVCHGYPFVVVRKIWKRDDGDNIPEKYEMTLRKFLSIRSNLDDDYPSVVFSKCCLVGYPEKNIFGNLGIDLLTKPGFGAAVSVVSSTRKPFLQMYFPDYPGGSDSMCYEFNRFLIKESDINGRIGDALYHSKNYYLNNVSFSKVWEDYPEYAHSYLIYDYTNLFNFNLYGDPSLKFDGIEN